MTAWESEFRELSQLGVQAERRVTYPLYSLPPLLVIYGYLTLDLSSAVGN
jgi:hypothetical protein